MLLRTLKIGHFIFCNTAKTNFVPLCKQIPCRFLRVTSISCIDSPKSSTEKILTRRFHRRFSDSRLNLISDKRILFLLKLRNQLSVNVAHNFGDTKPDSSSSSSKDSSNPKSDSSAKNAPNINDDEKDVKKLSIFKRFKVMWKKYWYVLLPVHLATSAVWFGMFYYASVGGLDIPGFIESIGFGETLVEFIKKYPQGGHFAVAYALYKVATPLRYAVTLSGTHYAIEYLSRMGYIKPVPTTAQMTTFFNEKRRQQRDRLTKFKLSRFSRRQSQKQTNDKDKPPKQD